MKNHEHPLIQKKIFILCFIAYTLAYVGRVNLSIALPIMEQSGQFNVSLLGIIGTAFFWVYAVGQLINGRLGDKIRLDLFIFTGLFVSSICNILFGFTTITSLLIILWAINGLFQSMLWGPIMRIISRVYPEEKRKNAGLGMFAACILGYLLVYLGLTQVLDNSYQYAFIIPGILLFVFSFIWLISNKKMNVVKHIEKSPTSYKKLLGEKVVILLVIFCIPLGFLREGVLLFTPLYLVKTFDIPLQVIMSQAILIPLFNFGGVLIARYLSQKITNIHRVIAIMFVMGLLSLVSIFIFAKVNLTLAILLISICSASFYGTTSLITSTIPIRHKHTSTLAGLLDFFIYFGAGLSGFAIILIS